MTKGVSSKIDKMRKNMVEKMWNNYLKYTQHTPYIKMLSI